MVTIFSTQVVPAGQRVRYWEEQTEANLMALSCTAANEQGFLARQVHLALPRMRFVAMHGAESSVGRTAAHIGRRPVDVLFLCLLTGGEAVFGQGSETVLVEPGEAIFYDPDVPFEYAFPRGLSQLVVEVPRVLFHGITGREGLLRPQLIRGGERPGSEGMARLADIVRASIREPATAGAREDEALGLVRGMLLEIPRSGSVGHVQVAMRFIEENASGPDLSVPRIAAGLGITPRHLNRLFSAAGLQVAGYVRQVRLERAHGLLLDPLHAHRNIGQIAVLAGFSDAAHFARTFKARYGYSASDVRRGTAT